MRFCLVILALAGCSKPAAPEYDAFHAERTADITGEWLTLIARAELHSGDNSVGAEGEVKLPADRAPGVIGTLSVGEKLLWKSGDQTRELLDDSHGEPTVFEHGSLRMHVITRGGSRFLRVKDLESPALKSFAGLQWFPTDAKWKVTALFEPSDRGTTVDITNVLQQTRAWSSPGTLRFEVDGKEYRLTALSDGEPNYFIVFKDESSGHGTYPAGRFIHVPLAVDGKTTIDFNRAYSPPCAFTSFATCPLPPPGNKLALKIEAGERFAGH
jgi:hypothetical protein